MVSVGKSLVHDVPSLIPRELLLIYEDTEQLNGGYGGVSVVELDLVLLRELSPVRVGLLVATDDVTDGGGAEEVLLLQSQFLTLV